MNILQRLKKFLREEGGSVAITVGLSMLPLSGMTGAAMDYAMAMRTATKLQAALDAATLTGAILTVDNRDERALAAFNAGVLSAGIGSNVTATFTTMASNGLSQIYSGQAKAIIPSAFLKIFGIQTISVTRTAKAAIGTGDTSCILTLGGDMDLSDDSMIFNGAPNVNLSGCALRSNQGIKCNGSNIGVSASIAAGVADKCPNPVNYAGQIPDIYAPLSASIEKKCGAQGGNVSWTNSSSPVGPNVIEVPRFGYREVHVCGNLNLSGSGALAGTDTSNDLVIVIENGDLNLADDTAITARRTTFVFTGANSAGIIDFPSGTGKTATLTVTSGTGDENPWRGIAGYQDPRMSNYVTQDWGPGAKLYFDGVNYFPKSDVVLRGVAGTGPSACSKIVSNSFRINGAVSLVQSVAGCKDQKVAQYQTWPRLIQ